MFSTNDLYNAESLPLDELIANLKEKQKEYESPEVTIEFGEDSNFMMDISTIVNKFTDTVFDMAVSEDTIEQYAMENDVTIEVAKEHMKMTKYIRMKSIPNSDGERIGSGQIKEDGGLANIIKTFVKLLCKIVGFAMETFISLLEPLQVLIRQYVQSDANPLGIGDLIFDELMAIATASVPATAAMWVAKKVDEIMKMIEQIKKIINDVIAKVMKVITDVQAFLVEQMLKLDKKINDKIGMVGTKIDTLVADKKQDMADKKNKREDKRRKRKEKRQKKSKERREKRKGKKKLNLGKIEFPFDNLGLIIPSLPLGFAGIKLPGIDFNENFDEAGNASSSEWLALAGLVSVDLINLIFNPVDELGKLGYDVSEIEGFEREETLMPTMEFKELEFYQRIYEDPILQLEYINALKKHNHINSFYSEPYDLTNNKYTHQYDFFKDFPLYDDNTNDVKILGLYTQLEEANLLDDSKFINGFYDLITSYNIDLITISDDLKDFYNENGYHFKNLNGDEVRLRNGVFQKRLWKLHKGKNGEGAGYYAWKWYTIKDINDVFDFNKFKNDNETNKKNFIYILELSYKLNFWNPVIVKGEPQYYIVGESNIINYKDFKLKFWNLIPKEKLKYFTTHLETYTLYYKDYSNHKDLLTYDFTQVLRFSNYRKNGEEEISGALNDNDFRLTIDIGEKFEKMFPDDMYNKETGFVDIKLPSFKKVLDIFKDKIPAVLSLILTNVDFITRFIIMPLNLMFSFLEKVMKIVTDCMSLNIVGAFSGLVNFVKELQPSVDIFEKLIKAALQPLIDVFTSDFAKDVVGVVGDIGNVGGDIGDKVGGVVKKTTDYADKQVDKIGDKVDTATDKVNEKVDKATDFVNDKISGITDVLGDITELVTELITMYVEPIIKIFGVITGDALPNLLMETLTALFQVVLKSVTDKIPIININ